MWTTKEKTVSEIVPASDLPKPAVDLKPPGAWGAMAGELQGENNRLKRELATISLAADGLRGFVESQLEWDLPSKQWNQVSAELAEFDKVRK